MNNSERIIRKSIAAPARQICHEGYHQSPDDPLKKKYKRRGKEAGEVWNNLKEERNALISILVDRVIERGMRLREQYPPYGLSEEQENFITTKTTSKSDESFNRQPYWAINEGIKNTLTVALRQELHYLEGLLHDKNASSPLKDVYKRYKEIIAFGKKHKKEERSISRMKEDAFLLSGINTGIQTINSLMEVTPKVYAKAFPEQQPDPALLEQIFTNSYSLAIDLAASHLAVFTVKHRRLGSGGGSIFSRYKLSPEHFRIVGYPHFPRLAYVPDIEEEFNIASSTSLKPDESSIATGCPALVDFKSPYATISGSAIKKLWTWFEELAPVVYRQSLISQTQ